MRYRIRVERLEWMEPSEPGRSGRWDSEGIYEQTVEQPFDLMALIKAANGLKDEITARVAEGETDGS